jgi:hypothetical protein
MRPKPEKKVRKTDEEKRDQPKKTTMVLTGKKLPFIGRMPVFKKQQSEKKEEAAASASAASNISQSTALLLNQPPPPPPPPEQVAMDIDEHFGSELMPDPVQFSALMATATRPQTNHHRMMLQSKNEDVLPPGIDATEDEFIPKPISDAPAPRRGPLPKDFQQALDILFDGDTPKPADVIANETKPPEVPEPEPEPEPVDPDEDLPQMILPEELAQVG